jgi:phosphoglycerol transferase MdoB-like AlkP superfamily enzyme
MNKKELEERIERLEGIVDDNFDAILKRIEEIEKAITREHYNKRITSTTYVSSPSNAWYFLPLLLGFIGGLIGYLSVKDNDQGMANSLLITGIITSILYIFILFIVFFGRPY